MKYKIVSVSVFLSAVLNVAAHDDTRVIASYEGALAKECFRIVDQDGNPVEGARVYGAFWPTVGGNEYVLVDGFSNANGEYVAQGITKDRLHYRITKNGYYKSVGDIKYHQTKSVPAVVNGQWQPFGTTRTVILKRIKKPVEMHCRDGLKNFKIPTYDQWMGFDFERYAFVAPFGDGVASDVLLKFTLKRPSKRDCHVTMDVSFTNNPYAGAYRLAKDGFSEMKTVYEANAERNYVKTFSFSYDQANGRSPVQKSLSESEYLVFRTRTQVDEKGNLVSARYGKICGQWHFVGPRGMSIDQFAFNPTPNDTNLEDAETARRSSQMWGTPSGVAQTESFWTSSGFASLLSVGKAWVRE